MPYKPIPTNKYQKYIEIVDWKLKKGSIDWNLYDEKESFLCSIKIIHGKGKKHEVAAVSVKKTENLFKKRGWSWPPRRK